MISLGKSKRNTNSEFALILFLKNVNSPEHFQDLFTKVGNMYVLGQSSQYISSSDLELL